MKYLLSKLVNPGEGQSSVRFRNVPKVTLPASGRVGIQLSFFRPHTCVGPAAHPASASLARLNSPAASGGRKGGSVRLGRCWEGTGRARWGVRASVFGLHWEAKAEAQK